MELIEREDALLVVIDVQGKLARQMWKREELFRKMRALIEGCRHLDVPILCTEQVPEKLGPTVAEIQESLREVKPVPKKSFSCLGSDTFLSAMERSGRAHLILCGIETHVCVYQTAMDLLARGFRVEVVEDAVSSRSEENRAIGLRRMELAGAHPTSVEMLLLELQKVAEGDTFRKLIQLIK